MNTTNDTPIKIEGACTVGQIAVDHPGTVRVFQRLGVDFCCGGRARLDAACEKKGLSLEQTLTELQEACNERQPLDDAITSGTLEGLVTHIVQTHHVFTRDELLRIEPLLRKVIGVHGDRHRELTEIGRLFEAMAEELRMHLVKEERILFPYIVSLEQSQHGTTHLESSCFGTVRNPVRMMMMEHDSAGEALARMRSLSNGYAPPADACGSFRALYHGLSELEVDLHRHIHLENNVLFPRAVALEEALAPEAV